MASTFTANSKDEIKYAFPMRKSQTQQMKTWQKYQNKSQRPIWDIRCSESWKQRLLSQVMLHSSLAASYPCSIGTYYPHLWGKRASFVEHVMNGLSTPDPYTA